MLLFSFLSIPFGVIAKSKVVDKWRGNTRHIESEIDKKNFGQQDYCLAVNILETGDTVWVIYVGFWTKTTEDPTIREGDKFLMRLGNDEVIEIVNVIEAAPKVISHQRYDISFYATSEIEPTRWAGYIISQEQLDKIATYGIKKVRFYHSNGFNDEIFSDFYKRFEKLHKSFVKLYDEVKKQLTMPPPPKPEEKPF